MGKPIVTGANVGEQRKQRMFVWVLTHDLRQSKASKRSELQGSEELLGRFSKVITGPHDCWDLGQVSKENDVFVKIRNAECTVRPLIKLAAMPVEAHVMYGTPRVTNRH